MKTKKVIATGHLGFFGEDGGAAQIAEVEVGKGSKLFFRIHSWDESKKHPELNELRNKKVQITLQVIE